MNQQMFIWLNNWQSQNELKKDMIWKRISIVKLGENALKFRMTTLIWYHVWYYVIPKTGCFMLSSTNLPKIVNWSVSGCVSMCVFALFEKIKLMSIAKKTNPLWIALSWEWLVSIATYTQYDVRVEWASSFTKATSINNYIAMFSMGILHRFT